jgi:putative membrane protein
VKTSKIILLFAGLALATGLLFWQGFGDVVGRIADAGWMAFWLPILYLVPLVLMTFAWSVLFLPGHTPSFAMALRATWIGGSVNALLPVATVGGDVVKARFLAIAGVPGSHAAALAVVDKTLQAVTLLSWGLVGFLATFYLEIDAGATRAIIVGWVLLCVGVAGFYAVQRAAVFGRLMKRVAGVTQKQIFHKAAEASDSLESVIHNIYARPGRVLLACLLRLVARAAMAAEIWLFAQFMGTPITPIEAIMVESLSAAVRGIAFAVPGALGVQEGSYVMLGALVGLDAELMLALSLAKRIRDIMVGLPGLVAWQILEGHRLWWHSRSRPRPSSVADPGA